MRLDVYLPLVLAAVFGLTAPGIARRLPPALATWLLSVGGAVCAAGSTAALGLLGWTLVGQTPDVAASGHWSTTALQSHDPVAAPVAATALVVLAVLTLRVAVVLVRRGWALAAAYRLAAALPSRGGQLVVVDDDTLPACAVPGRPGRIVVPAGLLRRLDAGQRRAVLAHERTHLDHHHHAHLTVGTVAAAANPMLFRLPSALALSTERWADEAAAVTTRRGTVAAALRRAAAVSPTWTAPSVVLAAAAGHVAARIAALSVPAPRPTAWRILALTGLALATALATVDAADDFHRLFELAMHAYQVTHVR